MWKLVVLLALFAGSAAANDLTLTSMQSGGNTTPIHDRGIRGEGQIIAVLDTGADWTSCFLAEPDGSAPPINTGTPAGGLDWQNIDLSRRKIIAICTAISVPHRRVDDVEQRLPAGEAILTVLSIRNPTPVELDRLLTAIQPPELEDEA